MNQLLAIRIGYEWIEVKDSKKIIVYNFRRKACAALAFIFSWGTPKPKLAYPSVSASFQLTQPCSLWALGCSRLLFDPNGEWEYVCNLLICDVLFSWWVWSYSFCGAIRECFQHWWGSVLDFWLCPYSPACWWQYFLTKLCNVGFLNLIIADFLPAAISSLKVSQWLASGWWEWVAWGGCRLICCWGSVDGCWVRFGRKWRFCLDWLRVLNEWM